MNQLEMTKILENEYISQNKLINLEMKKKMTRMDIMIKKKLNTY